MQLKIRIFNVCQYTFYSFISTSRARKIVEIKRAMALFFSISIDGDRDTFYVTEIHGERVHISTDTLFHSFYISKHYTENTQLFTLLFPCRFSVISVLSKLFPFSLPLFLSPLFNILIFPFRFSFCHVTNTNRSHDYQQRETMRRRRRREMRTE